MYFCVVLCIFVLFYVFLCCSIIFVLFYVFLCCSMYFCVVLCIFVLFYVFLCCSIYFCVVLCIFVLFYLFLCFSMYFCVVLRIFVLFSALFVCICALNYCHRVATQLQLNISYHLYFRTVHVVIFILFKPTHALFLKHIHIHI
jgi:hypothetical protein